MERTADLFYDKQGNKVQKNGERRKVAWQFLTETKHSQKRVLSQPVVPVPKTVKETLNVVKAYENGCFRLEPKKRNTLYDRAYLFEDVNYINKDKGEKRLFLSELMDFF